MIVPQAEIDLILNPRIHRRMMWLPVERGDQGERLPCPVREQHVYRLQPRAFVKSRVEITVLRIRQMNVAALDLADARRMGYGGVAGAWRAWQAVHGQGAMDALAWAIYFARGDHRALLGGSDEPVFLTARSGRGDYTRLHSKAMRGEPETVDRGLLREYAQDEATRRRRKRTSAERRTLLAAAGELEMLRDAMTEMKARNLLRRSARNLRKAASLLSGDGLDSGGRTALQRIGPPGEAGRLPPNAKFVDPETEGA